MPLPTLTKATEALARYVEESPTEQDVIDAATVALELVSGKLTPAKSVSIPDAIGSLAVVECGAAIYYRRTARNGIVSYDGADVQPMRIAKDPLSTVYTILSPYMSPGIA